MAGLGIPHQAKRRTVITLSHSNQPAGLQLFAAVVVEQIASGRVLVLDLFSFPVMLRP
jgi:hypothetical protein